MGKDFDSWHKTKIKLDGLHKPPYFKEREIWWCSIGVNIGFEVYGKGHIFTRPVLILRQFSQYTFLGAPLTSKAKSQPFHYPFSFKGENGSVVFGQIRTYDSRRLANRMGRISKKQFEKIRNALKNML